MLRLVKTLRIDLPGNRQNDRSRDVCGQRPGANPRPNPQLLPIPRLAQRRRLSLRWRAMTRAQYNSTQQILDRRLQLRGIIRPDPINLEAVSADRAAIGGAPLGQSLASGGQFHAEPPARDP